MRRLPPDIVCVFISIQYSMRNSLIFELFEIGKFFGGEVVFSGSVTKEDANITVRIFF